jgi:ribosomal protein L12E/L44/L45/RPP1/RPP2
MRHLAAYLLLVLGGNATPSAEQVNAVITAAGGEADEAKVTALLADLEGKDIHELLAKVGLLSLKFLLPGARFLNCVCAFCVTGRC